MFFKILAVLGFYICRLVPSVGLIVGSVKLDDQFEWDLDNPSVPPKEFTEVYTQELGLGGEFKCVTVPFYIPAQFLIGVMFLL